MYLIIKGENMYLKQLKMKNFRGIANCTINLHPKMNIFIGNNGSGKSTIMDACKILLSFLSNTKKYNILPEEHPSIFDVKRDLTIGKDEGYLHSIFDTAHFNIPYSISCSIDKNSVQFNDITDLTSLSEDFNFDYYNNYKQLLAWGNHFRNPIVLQDKYDTLIKDTEEYAKELDDENAKELLKVLKKDPKEVIGVLSYIANNYLNNLHILPVIVYYGMERAFVKTDIRESDINTRGRAYKDWMSGDANFDLFLGWYSQQDKNTITTVNKTIKHFINIDLLNMEDGILYIEQTSIDNQKMKLDISLLSQGEKLYIALIADITRRLIQLNANRLDNPLDGYGCIFIDEVELHLHPKWQREILPKLTEIFPNCQFIVTSHSPQAISSLHDCSVFVVNSEVSIETPYELLPESNMYGKTSDQILEYIMDSPKRDSKIEGIINDIYQSLHPESLDIPKAEASLDELEQLIGNDAEVTKVRALIQRIQLLGR